MKYLLATGIMAYSLASAKAMPAKMDQQMKREMEGMHMADMDMQHWMDNGMQMDLPWMNGEGMDFDMEHMMNMQNMENMHQQGGDRENDQPKMADVVDQLMQDQQMREIIQKWRDNTSEWDREEKEYTESDSDNYDNVVVTRVDNSFVYIKPIVNNNNAVISNENEGNTNVNNNNMLVMFNDDGAKKIDWEQLMEAMEEWEASSAMKTPVQPMTGTMEDEETESSEMLPEESEVEESEFDFSEEPISVWSPDTPTWTVDTPKIRESPSYTCVNCLFDGEEQPEEVATPVEEETEGEVTPVEPEGTEPAEEEPEVEVSEPEVEVSEVEEVEVSEATEVIPEVVEDILDEIAEVEFSEVDLDELPF